MTDLLFPASVFSKAHRDLTLKQLALQHVFSPSNTELFLFDVHLVTAVLLQVLSDTDPFSLSLSSLLLAWSPSSHCIQQIVESVNHCHTNGIVHRDLKVSKGQRLKDSAVLHLVSHIHCLISATPPQYHTPSTSHPRTSPQRGVVGRLAGDEAVGCVVQAGAGRCHHSLPLLYAMKCM